MPKKRNFLGGMQNYNAQTGEYEPALKGPNGESPSGFKSFKKQEEKDESFDTVNKKRMGIDKKISEWEEENPEGKVLKGKSVKEIEENAENDFTSEDYVDDFYDRVSDLQKEVNTSGIDDDEYDAEINKLKEELETKKDSMSEDDYNKTKEMLDRFSRPTDDENSWKDYELLQVQLDQELKNAKKRGATPKELRDIQNEYREKMNSLGESSFDQINAKRMGKERAKPFKMPGTLRQRYNEYLKNGFSGKDIDKWNEEIEFIESKLPFKDEQEHQKWLDMASNWKGEPEWINMTNELIDRYNKSGEGGMDIEFRNFIKNPYDYEGTHSQDFVNKVLEHGRENYPNHPYFKKKPKLPF